MGKYDNIIIQLGKTDPLVGNPKAEDDWTPEKRTQDFIRAKIISLGTIESVNNFYNSNDPISKYARRIAATLLKKKIKIE
jgi:hypothetical protein